MLLRFLHLVRHGSSRKPHATLPRLVYQTHSQRCLLGFGGCLQVHPGCLIHAMNGVDVLLLQSAVIIPPHPVKLSCRNVEGAVICVFHALVSLPFSEMKGAKIQFDRRLGAHRMSSRPPTRTATSGKNYWAILRGTGVPESIRAIGVSYSLLGAFAEHDQRVVARVGALLLDEQTALFAVSSVSNSGNFPLFATDAT